MSRHATPTAFLPPSATRPRIGLASLDPRTRALIDDRRPRTGGVRLERIDSAADAAKLASLPDGAHAAVVPDHGVPWWQLRPLFDASRPIDPRLASLALQHFNIDNVTATDARVPSDEAAADASFARLHGCVTKLIGDWMRQMPAARAESLQVDISEGLLGFALDAFGELAIGVPLSDQRQELLDCLQTLAMRSERSGVGNWFKKDESRALDEQVQRLRAPFLQAISQRARAPEEHPDLLARLLEARPRGAPIDREPLVDEMLYFVVASALSTAAVLASSVHLLLRDPLAAQRSLTEIDRVIGEDEPRRESFSRLQYLRRVLLEAMRLAPVSPMPVCRVMQPFELPRFGPCAADSLLLLAMPRIHRDPARWGEDADMFRPERHTAEDVLHWSPIADRAWAARCASSSMSLSMLTLSMLVQRFDWAGSAPDADRKADEAIRWTPGLVPRIAGLHIALRTRSTRVSGSGIGTAAVLERDRADEDGRRQLEFAARASALAARAGAPGAPDAGGLSLDLDETR